MAVAGTLVAVAAVLAAVVVAVVVAVVDVNYKIAYMHAATNKVFSTYLQITTVF